MKNSGSAVRRLVRAVSVVLGLALLAGGVGAVLFVDWNPLPPAPPPVVRPVKSALAVDAGAAPQRRFTGQVLAGRGVELAFQVGGPLIEANLTLGREVQPGEVLTRIDPTRFQQQIAILEPQVAQTRQRLERIKELVVKNAATRQELLDAQAAADVAAAQLDVARQTLKDSVLTAPFRALIVQRFADNHQTVQAGAPAVKLQDISSLDIAVSVPESVVARHRQDAAVQRLAVFPTAPDKAYPVTVKEASAEADAQTGAYRVVFTMPRPDDLTVLPGMAATIVAMPQAAASGQISVPVEALWVDSAGAHQVWRLVAEGAAYTVRRAAVTVDRLDNGLAIVTQGLAVGDRVVTAGVPFVREGQAVRLMEAPQ